MVSVSEGLSSVFVLYCEHEAVWYGLAYGLDGSDGAIDHRRVHLLGGRHGCGDLFLFRKDSFWVICVW